MIKVESLNYSPRGVELLKNASFSIEDGVHCALIGANGVGKTTLIDLMLHPEDYLFKGKVIMQDIHRVGYVNQFVEHEKDRDITVLAYLSEDFEKMQAEMDALCEKLESDEDMENYQRMLDEFAAVDGYNYEVNIRKELSTAGIEAVAEVSLANISGGEYKLVQIIRQMLSLPDILVMDEPDVFLDFENLRGLRELINTHSGTVLTATHNRYLLNNCFDKILQIENSNVQEYEGGYMDFCATQLRMKIELQELSQKETEFIAFEEQLVERLRDDASKHPDLKKGRTLRARVSYVERWKARHTQEPYIESRIPQIKLPAIEDGEGADYALEVCDYGIAFDSTVLEKVSFTILPGEKAALVGANGTGKTTLLRSIFLGGEPTLNLHPAMRPAFLSQFHGETLNENGTVWQLMDSLGFPNEKAAAEYLASYCFDEDILCHPIRTLSGGEKNLLQLAVLGLGESNFLLLDEPTSHLDLRAQLALEKAIGEYKGTVLMVSHDFYTIADCMDYVLLADEHTVRKMSARAFRKMIYRDHFSKNYLELEQKKKSLEVQINSLIKGNSYEQARQLCLELDSVVSQLSQ